MQQWEYVKGSEKDFHQAPPWATMVITGGEFEYEWFLESFTKGEQRHRQVISEYVDVYLELHYSPSVYDVIAERRPLSETVTTTESLIAERGNRYGEFKDGAAIMQQLKQVMHNTPKWESLKPSQKEALDMIQHKIGRILNGDPDYDDNWKDIAGYATLIVKELPNGK